MKFSRTFLLLGLILVLPTLSTNPSHSQSLKDKLNQDKEKEKIRKQNCDRIQESGQYQTKTSDYKWDTSGSTIFKTSLKKVTWDNIQRYYIDPQDNVHYVSFSSYETTESYKTTGDKRGMGDKKYPNMGEKKYPNIYCEPFISKIGKSIIKKGKCKFNYDGSGTIQTKDVTEYHLEGNELTKYTQTLFLHDCHTSNPRESQLGDIETEVFKKFR